MGGGPAGSFFSYFCLGMAERVGLNIELDLYEPRDFSRPAPHGCNMCGGVISESLVLALASASQPDERRGRVMGMVGGVSALISTYLFVVGPDPNRYTKFRRQASLWRWLPTPGVTVAGQPGFILDLTF